MATGPVINAYYRNINLTELYIFINHFITKLQFQIIVFYSALKYLFVSMEWCIFLTYRSFIKKLNIFISEIDCVKKCVVCKIEAN